VMRSESILDALNNSLGQEVEVIEDELRNPMQTRGWWMWFMTAGISFFVMWGTVVSF